jgi:hypothetical protein
MLPEERLSTAASRSRVRAAARSAEGRLGRPADAIDRSPTDLEPLGDLPLYFDRINARLAL